LEAYLRLARYYPNESVFRGDNFRWVPSALVRKAIFEYEKIDRDRLHLEERPIAQLTNLLYSVNRDPKNSKPRSLDDWCLYGKPKDDRATPNTAAVFIALASEGKLPDWLMTQELMEEMQEASKLGTGTFSGIRLLVSDRAALFCAKVQDTGASCEYAVLNEGPNEAVTVRDVDSGEVYSILPGHDVSIALTGSDAFFSLGAAE
jgi:hypothetical protein